MEKVAKKHYYGEAFMMMTYETEDGSESERIWNSRDGISPFCVKSRNGKGLLQHVRWNEDEYLPEHTPEPGDRVFVGSRDEVYVITVPDGGWNKLT